MPEKYKSLKISTTQIAKELVLANKELNLKKEQKVNPENKSALSKPAQEKIAVSENRYQALFENMPSGFVLFEVVENDKGLPIDLVIITANEKFAATTELKLKDAIGKHLTYVLPGIEKDAADWIGTYSKVALTGEPKQLEQGSELLGYFYSVTAYQSGPKRCAVIFDDISERKKIESQLLIEKERTTAILDLVGNPIFLKDNDHRITAANHAFYDLFGMDENSVIGKTLAENVPEKEMRHFMKIDRDVLDTGIPDIREEELTIKGVSHTIITEKKRHIDGSGTKFLVCTIHDITNQKQLEYERNLENQRFLNTLESMTDGFVALDRNWNYTHINKIAAELFDRKSEDLIGKNIWTEFPEGIGQPFYTNYFKAVETNLPLSFEDYYQPWNRWFENRVIPSENGLAIFFNDITVRKKAELELQKHKEHLEELVKERTKEIEKKNITLEKMNNLFVGRELRMKELKEEIKSLKKE